MGDGAIVYLTETPDPNDYFCASGRFSGSVVVGDQDGEQLDDATLDEALSWARERADVVLLRLHDSPPLRHFSAGARHADANGPVWDDSTVVRPRRLRERTLRIPSGAMAPTLNLGEHVIVSRDANYAPEVGDIVVFHPPAGADPPPAGADPANWVCGNPEQGAGHSAACSSPVPQKSSQTFIKRIVAGPRESLAIVEGRVVRNGEPAKEPYVITARIRDVPSGVTIQPGPDCNFPTPIVIPPDHYFVLGDNRPESDDSRFWGPIPRAWIIGKIETPNDAANAPEHNLGS